MAQDSTQIAVAGGGTVWVANYGATAPTGLATPGGQWSDLGYCDDTGVTFVVGRTTQDLAVWQSFDPARILVTAQTKTISFVLEQFNPTNVLTALGGGTATTSGTVAGTVTYPDPSDITAKAIIVDALDGTATYRFYYPRMQVEGDVTINLQRGDAMKLPVTFRQTASTSTPVIISNAGGWHS